MRFAVFAILASAGIAVAQTSAPAAPTGSPDECDAQNIVKACVDGYQSRIDGCGSNDWICLCDVYSDVLVCYNNCPNSNERPPVQNQVTSFCNAAAPLKSASSASAATARRTSASATSASATATQSDSGASQSATGSSTGSSSFETGAASALDLSAIGGAFAMVLGIVGLL